MPNWCEVLCTVHPHSSAHKHLLSFLKATKTNGGVQCNCVIAILKVCCMLQEISKIVGEMWQRATPEEKAPYVEQVSMQALKHCHSICMQSTHWNAS